MTEFVVGSAVSAKRFFENGDHEIGYGYVVAKKRYGVVIRFGDGTESFRYFNSVALANS